MVFAVMCLLLAANFWVATPTFDPWPGKTAVGVIFLLIGAWQVVFLRLMPNLSMVRLGSVVTSFFLAGGGIVNSQQAFAGKASFQLPILYFALAMLHFWLLVEAPVNPYTRRKA